MLMPLVPRPRFENYSLLRGFPSKSFLSPGSLIALGLLGLSSF